MGALYRLFITILLFYMGPLAHAQLSVKIGAPLPLTGKLALEGAKQQRGYELWADKVNQQGGIQIAGESYQVEIIYKDYQSDTAKSRQAVKELITQEKIKLLFAPYGSNAAKEASVLAERYQVPMIAVTASSPQAYSRGHQYIFGIFTPNKTLIEPLFTFIEKQKPNTQSIALIVRKDLFPLSLAREVVNTAKQHNLQVVFYEKYNIADYNFANILMGLKGTQIDWIFALGYTNDLVQLRKTMADMEINPPLLTMIAAPAYQEFIDATGSLSENITSSAWWHPSVKYTGIDIFANTENFVKAFTQRYNKLPDYVEASATLAGCLFQIALQRANSLEGKLIRDELAKMDENTFWGPIKFAKNGQNQSSSPIIFQLQQQQTMILYPEQIKTGELKLGTTE